MVSGCFVLLFVLRSLMIWLAHLLYWLSLKGQSREAISGEESVEKCHVHTNVLTFCLFLFGLHRQQQLDKSYSFINALYHDIPKK